MLSEKAKRKLGLIGLGRFGLLFARILKDDFDLVAYDENTAALARAKESGIAVANLEETLAREIIIYCVPISLFEEIFKSHRNLLERDGTKKTVIDVLSVKSHPKQVFAKEKPQNVRVLLTHPMFGPDSIGEDLNLTGKRIVVDRLDLDDGEYAYFLDYFRTRGMEVLELSCDRHDELAARSQGIAHFIGRMLEHAGIEPTSIDTLGATRLNDLKNQVANDTWQLFDDLQYYNPYSRETVARLTAAQKAIYARAMPNRIYKERLVVGIQGGRGSFNEEAARYYLSRTPEEPFELVYLHTTENVLRALEAGDIDRGQFAIHNSVGGLVQESAWAMAGYRFQIVEEFGIKIAHALMIRKDSRFDQIDTIMAHPQVFSQCKDNLAHKYSKLELKVGEGELIDHARVAELMAAGEIPANVATMGSRVLAEINDLKIVEENLQDSSTNFTQFLFVERLQQL